LHGFIAALERAISTMAHKIPAVTYHPMLAEAVREHIGNLPGESKLQSTLTKKEEVRAALFNRANGNMPQLKAVFGNSTEALRAFLETGELTEAQLAALGTYMAAHPESFVPGEHVLGLHDGPAGGAAHESRHWDAFPRLEGQKGRIFYKAEHDNEGFVYFLYEKRKGGLWKVGVTHARTSAAAAAAARAEALSTGNASELVVYAVIRAETAKTIESALHLLLARRATAHHGGAEWYHLTSTDVDAILALMRPMTEPELLVHSERGGDDDGDVGDEPRGGAGGPRRGGAGGAAAGRP
jgi:hypothetical protein